MRISSPAIPEHLSIPREFTCQGRNVNPALHFEDVPAQAGSLALVVDDPDFHGDHPWVHWTVWNIDPGVRDLPEDSVPAGAVQGLNDFGDVRWGGPCPPAGKPHHYRFKAYALSGRLTLPWGSRESELEKAMADRILAQAEFVGTFQRSR